MNRVLWIDLIRVTGAFLVVMSHVSLRVAIENGEGQRSLGWLVAECFHSLSYSIAVPLFLMVSGALLLERNVEMIPFYRKRFGKILLPFFAWSCVFLFCLWIAERPLRDGTPVTFFTSIGALLSGNVNGHFWFMYMLVSLYLVVPFLSVFVRNAPKNVLIGFLMLWYFAVVIFPVINTLAQDTLGITDIAGYSFVERGTVSYSVGFFIGGYVFKDVLLSKRWAIIAIVACLCLAMSPINLYLRLAYPDSTLAFLLTLLGKYVLTIVAHPVTMSLVAFLGLRSLGDLPALSASRFSQAIVNFAPLTFGIFLCHQIFVIPGMEFGNTVYRLGTCTSGIVVLVAVPALTVFFYFVAAGVVYVIRRNRYLQALLAP